MYHYVYRITNKVVGKHYYGARSSKVQPKEDIGIKYFSSSKDKEFKLDQKVNKLNYKYKVVKVFDTRSDAVAYEIKLHSKFNVSTNNKFYNKASQTSTGFDTTGVLLKELRDYAVSDETKDKLRQHNLGKKHSEETKIKMSKSRKGRVVSEETRRKISIANSTKVRTEAEKAHLSALNTGKTLSAETKEKIRVAMTGRKVTDEFREKIRQLKTGTTYTISKELCKCGRLISTNNIKRHKLICSIFNNSIDNESF